jgi:adenylate cyclase
MEYTVVGDAVNVASRLTSAAKAGEILLTRMALEPAAERLEVKSLPPLHVKGKTEPLEVFCLVGKKETGTQEGSHGA